MALPVDIFPTVLRAIDLLGQGKTLTEACDLAGVNMTTLRRYIETGGPELAELFNDAEQRGYDRMADELANVHTWGVDNGVTDPKMLKIVSDNRKWLLARRRPQQYGERVHIEHSITADKAIIEALSQGKQRALDGVIEDVTYTVIKETVNIEGVNLDIDLLQFVTS